MRDQTVSQNFNLRDHNRDQFRLPAGSLAASSQSGAGFGRPNLPLAFVIGCSSLLGITVLLTSACGYRVAGRSSTGLPSQVRTIAVPTFQNQTFQFKIEQKLTAAVIHEFLTRTSYHIQSDPDGSDAIIQGMVTSITSGTIVFDPSSGRTTKALLTIGVRVSVLDAKTRKPIYDATDLSFREPYEVSTDSATYFAEDSPALDRLSRDVASSLVSTILENF